MMAMVTPRDVITEQPSSGELSLIPGSRQIAPTSLEYGRRASGTYPQSMLSTFETSGSRRMSTGYTQREAGFTGNQQYDMAGSGRLNTNISENQYMSSVGGEGRRRESVTGLEGQRTKPIITRQPGENSNTNNNSTNFKKRTSILSTDSGSVDAAYAREIAPLGLHDVIRIRQQMEADLNRGCGSGNSYVISSLEGQTLFTVGEDPNCFCRWVCGPARMSHMTLYDLDDQPVLHFDRACCRCDCCCCFNCCLCGHELTIRDARGNVVGSIKEKFHVFQLKLFLQDADGKVAMQVLGPCCPLRCCAEMTFDITNSTGLKEVGYILKKWNDNPLEGVDVDVDHENIEITMPQHVNIEERVLILGAAMLANLMYMEMS